MSSFHNPGPELPPPDSPLFAATLSPNRSLGPTGTLVLIGLVGLASLILSIPFVLAGAWPVGGFFGLDIALLYWAFRVNNQRARAYEAVILSRIELLLRQVGSRGQAREWRFNPLWVRLLTEEDPDYGMMRLAFAQGRQEIDVGAFLSPDERGEFTAALRDALAMARRG